MQPNLRKTPRGGKITAKIISTHVAVPIFDWFLKSIKWNKIKFRVKEQELWLKKCLGFWVTAFVICTSYFCLWNCKESWWAYIERERERVSKRQQHPEELHTCHLWIIRHTLTNTYLFPSSSLIACLIFIFFGIFSNFPFNFLILVLHFFLSLLEYMFSTW